MFSFYTCVYCSLLLGAPVRAGFPACVRVCLVSTCVYCSLLLGAPVRAGFPACVRVCLVSTSGCLVWYYLYYIYVNK